MPALADADRRRLGRPDRRRASGAGHPTALAPRDRVLPTVVRRRRSPPDAALGSPAGVDEATGRRARPRVLPVLAALGRAAMRLPDPGQDRRPPLGALLAATPALAVLAATPALAVLVETFAQPVQRPTERAAADTDYGGPKPRHARKSQVAANEAAGTVAGVPARVRGPTRAPTLAKASGRLGRLPPGGGAPGDLGDRGIAAAQPAGLGATPREAPRGKDRPPEDVAATRACARRRATGEPTIRRRQHTARVAAGAGLVNRCLAAPARAAPAARAAVVPLPARPPAAVAEGTRAAASRGGGGGHPAPAPIPPKI